MVFKGVQKRLGIRVIRYLDVIGIGVLSSCEGAKFDVWRSLIVFFEGGYGYVNEIDVFRSLIELVWWIKTGICVIYRFF